MTNILRALIIILYGALSVPKTLAQDKFDEIGVKAGIIASFIAFTSWPHNPSTAKETKFLLCIAGDDPYSEIFKKAPSSGIRGRALVVQALPEEVSGTQLILCHVLVIRLNSKRDITKLLQKVSNLPILTISEFNNDRNHMSMINMARNENQIVFSINRAPSNQVGIEFRSKLLRLARKVIGGEQ